MKLPRSSFQYQKKEKDDSLVEEALTSLVGKHPAIGFWQCHHRLRHQGEVWNHKRVRRVYRKLRLNIRRRSKKRLLERVKQPLMVPTAPNQIWSLDFMSDTLTDGRKFRLLNIIDDYNRESLVIEADTSLPSQRVIRALEKIMERRGRPSNLRTDNGPEFLSHKRGQWCEQHQITLQFIQPGRPMQNAYIERKNGSLRRELLDAYLFTSLREVRTLCEEWRVDYNEARPHKALNYLSPMKYAERYDPSRNEVLQLYPQTANENTLPIEESRLVDKVLEKPADQKPNPLLLNGPN